MFRVLISDKISPAALDVLKESAEITVDYRPGLSPSELLVEIPNADALLIRSNTTVTAEVLAHAGRLKLVGRAGIGVDNVDVPAATARGIVVMNTPQGNAITTAEHTIAMIMAAARNIATASAAMRQGRWEKSALTGTELSGKTLGLIGVGNIGSLVAERAQGLGMKVIAFDPFLAAARAEGMRVALVDFEALLAAADVISIHTPLTDATRGMFSAAALGRMRKHAVLVNCARGGIIDEAALVEALEAGTIRAAAIDVFEQEPLPADNPLLRCESPRLTLTPHLGASTHEAQEKVAYEIAMQARNYLLEGEIKNALNMPALSAADARVLAPYIAMAREIGAFAAQMRDADDVITALELVLEGGAARLMSQPLLQSVVAELLRPSMEAVNIVNALMVAQDRGIHVSTRLEESCEGYHNRLVLRLCIGGTTWRSVAGSVITPKRRRVVGLNDVELEFALTPHMLYVRNRDIPGQIGQIGTTLGAHGVNISGFHHARIDAQEAIGIVKVDDAVPGSALKALLAIEGVVKIKALAI